MEQLSLFGFDEQAKPVKKDERPVAEERSSATKEVLSDDVKDETFDEAISLQPIPTKAFEETNNVTPIENEEATTIIDIDENLFDLEEEPSTVDRQPPTEEENTVEPSTINGRRSTTNIPSLKKRGRRSFKEMDAEIDLVDVPEDEELFQKQYYAISTVAQWFRVNTSLLRFWENEFDILKPKKNRKGDRLFRPEDVKNLQVIYYLLRQRKFSIEGAKEYLRSNKKNIDANLQIIESLTKFKSFLLELKVNLGA